MLIHFRSDGGDITMFGDAALPLIKMMGHSGTVPSAILAPDLPGALDRLKRAVAAEPASPPQSEESERDQGPHVSLQQRAFPLIELVERCAKNGYDLLWEQQR